MAIGSDLLASLLSPLVVVSIRLMIGETRLTLSMNMRQYDEDFPPSCVEGYRTPSHMIYVAQPSSVPSSGYCCFVVLLNKQERKMICPVCRNNIVIRDAVVIVNVIIYLRYHSSGGQVLIIPPLSGWYLTFIYNTTVISLREQLGWAYLY